jgi:hypothetical protein
MATGQLEQFNCDGCGKSYRWKAELAGKRVKCKCGHTMTVPQPPVEVESDDPFGDALSAMAEAEHTGATVAAEADLPRCPSCASQMAHGSVVCTQCGYNAKTGKTKKAMPMGVGGSDGDGFALAPAAVASSAGPMNMLAYAGARRSHVIKGGEKVVDNNIGDPVKDVAIPSALFLLGVLVTFCEARYGRGMTGIAEAMAFTGFMVLFNIALVFAGIMIAVKVADLGLGPIGPALLKIAAISVLPGAVAGMLLHVVGLNGVFIVWIVSLILTYGMFMGMLGLDLRETLMCTGIIWVVRTWVGYALVGLLLGALFSSNSGSGTMAKISSGGLTMMSGSSAAPLKAPTTGPKVTAADLDAKSMAALNASKDAMEARAWVAAGTEAHPHEVDRFTNNSTSKGVIDNLYAEGALRVMITKTKYDGDYQYRARQFVITLPPGKGTREGLISWGRFMVHAIGGSSQPDVGQKYLLVDLDGVPTLEEAETFRDQDEGKY